MPPLKEWVGKSIKESDIAAKHKVSILGIKKKNDTKISVMATAGYVIRESDHLLIVAANEAAETLLKQNKNKFVK
jgi:trk system potassium uptake protein TrkA